MPELPKLDIRAALRVFVGRGVEFIVVGGVGAALRGAIYATLDLDIVHRRTEENIARVVEALADLEAVTRFQPDKKLRPNETHLRTKGHQLLLTRFGAVDVLGSLGNDLLDYEQLLPDSSEMMFEGMTIRVLTLEALIRSKESAGRDKDEAVLPMLRAALAEKRKHGADD